MIFLRTVAIIWVVVWLGFTVPELVSHSSYLALALRSSTEELRVLHSRYNPDPSCADYPSVLKLCDALLPKGEALQIVIPREPSERFEFLYAKGRYLLYPRNYGNNTVARRYVLVYNVPDYFIPPGCEVIKTFAPHKYLLAERSRRNLKPDSQ